MDAAEGSIVEALQRRVAAFERERERLAERYAVLDVRWRRSSVGAVILFRAAQQVWTAFARWQDTLERRRSEREVDAAWAAFDRIMAGLPAALADETARPDPEPIETIEHLVLALRALVESARPGEAGVVTVQAQRLEAARSALERYEKLRWLDSG